MLRYFLGLVLLLLTLLVLEAAAVTVIDVSIHNTGLQRGFVMTEGSLKPFNILNMILSLTWFHNWTYAPQKWCAVLWDKKIIAAATTTATRSRFMRKGVRSW